MKEGEAKKRVSEMERERRGRKNMLINKAT